MTWIKFNPLWLRKGRSPAWKLFGVNPKGKRQLMMPPHTSCKDSSQTERGCGKRQYWPI